MRGRAVAVLAFVLFAGCSIPRGASAFDFLPGAEGFDGNVYKSADQLDTEAGSHPVAMTFNANFDATSAGGGEAGLRNLSVELPPGLLENPTATAEVLCRQTGSGSQNEFKTPRISPWEESLSGESCEDRSQVGVITLRSSVPGRAERTFGLFGLIPRRGAPAELGARPYGEPIVFVPSFRQAEGEYGITLTASDIPEQLHVVGLTVTIWGAPWSVINNDQRGNCLNELEPEFAWAKCSVGRPTKNEFTPLAYLTLPTSCEEPMDFGALASSWGQGEEATRRTAGKGSLSACEGLRFEPFAEAQVQNPRASSPSGYAFHIKADTEGFKHPQLRASTPVRKATVALPDGITINPSVGAGLGVCTPTQYKAETATSPFGAGCPGESRIGDFLVKTPIVARPINGSIFLAAPRENPSESLLAVYLVAKSIERGVLVKVAGELDPNPTTGKLTAVFDKLPQLPYEDLEIHFREGQRSPLATPAACGPLSTQVDFNPWRNPEVDVHKSLPDRITSGVGGGPCPSGPAPFVPQAIGGMRNSRAGAYTPFYLHLTRQPAEQEITSYSAKFPPGLLGKIAGIPYCPESDIELARHRSGVAERDRPSCPAASLIGHTYSGYGVGSVLAYAPGNLYLAGPYRGSSFSVVAIDSALVGPFDLGTVIVRSAVRIDPLTTQASIDASGTDPIPHILDGIPIHLRDVRVYIDRPNFTVNPTSCDPFQIVSAMNGSGQRFGDPSDDTLASATAPFQAFDCPSLAFKPRINLRLKGGTKRGDYPSLRVTVRPRPGDANIASSQVRLPPSLFFDQSRIQAICTNPQFAARRCPPGSIYGHVRAYTPLLEAPMEGPAYLRSSQHTLPDLVFALRGQGVEVDVVGRIDAFRGGIRGTFASIPDAPVSKFVLRMNGGKRGVLVAAGNLCRGPQIATARFIGHANRGWRLHPEVKPECKRKKRR